MRRSLGFGLGVIGILGNEAVLAGLIFHSSTTVYSNEGMTVPSTSMTDLGYQETIAENTMD